MVEFRHRSWLEPEAADRTLAFLRSLGATYVMVDAPRTDARNLVPTVVAATSDTAYLRLHGRNAATWNVRGRSAAERFDYLYSREELAEWSAPLRQLSSLSERTYAMFNNNGRTHAGGRRHRPGADERPDAARAAPGGRRAGHGFATISPSVSTPRIDAEPWSGRGSSAESIVGEAALAAAPGRSRARAGRRSRCRRRRGRRTRRRRSRTARRGLCDSVGTTRPAARLTAIAVSPVRHHAR